MSTGYAEEDDMIWANNIDAASALHHEIADRWFADAAERRALRHAFGGTTTERR